MAEQGLETEQLRVNFGQISGNSATVKAEVGAEVEIIEVGLTEEAAVVKAAQQAGTPGNRLQGIDESGIFPGKKACSAGLLSVSGIYC